MIIKNNDHHEQSLQVQIVWTGHLGSIFADPDISAQLGNFGHQVNLDCDLFISYFNYWNKI